MRRFLVPEAIQTSAMDCGPASLKALLEGFGIHASYGRLREACQTGVDGTSIDALETAAAQLGLDASQVMVPADHLLLPESKTLPALVVVRQPSGQTHFVVVWRRHGAWLQIMDPAVGRRWTRADRFLDELYVHTQAVPADDWNEWAQSDEFQKPLGVRLRQAGVNPGSMIGSVPLARLDAATRMVESLTSTGALSRGAESGRVLDRIARSNEPIPVEYWSAAPAPDDPGTVLLRGAVLLKVSGTRPPDVSLPELAAALSEIPVRPARELLSRIKALPALVVAGALAVAAAAVVVEAVLLRGFFDLGNAVSNGAQRERAVAVLLAFVTIVLALEFSIARGVLGLARTLETRLRLAFLRKIPRLEDRYFQSRPISDMGDRSHNVHLLRNAPDLAARFLRALCEMAITVAAIAWFYPAAGWAALALAVLAAGIPIAAQPMLAERDLKLRSHSGALTRFYLDALLGLTAIRAHRGARAVQREQETLLGEWGRAGMALQRVVTGVEGVQLIASFLLASWIVWTHVQSGAAAGSVLLLVYWVLNLPALGQEAAVAAWQYPMLRNTALRLIEPLGAAEAPFAESDVALGPPAIRIEQVTVQAGGHTILNDVTVDIPAGSHVAIVGPSGAGKSSLVGLLLGWHRPSAGQVLIDGQLLDPAMLDALRKTTAWVDPQVQLWNKPLDYNLSYGAPDAVIDEALEQAELGTVLARLPDGLHSLLGEGGALVSGGEGQRVRMGRAIGRAHAGLVILDEAARGLDRSRRRSMIERARSRWPQATMLCITHDVEDTQGFDRVLVIEDGRIVEEGPPAYLAGDPGSRYRALLDAGSAVRQGLWSSEDWRRLRLEEGRLDDSDGRASHAGS